MSYVTLDSLSNVTISDPFALHLNIRSLAKHFDELKTDTLFKSRVRFVALSETQVS